MAKKLLLGLAIAAVVAAVIVFALGGGKSPRSISRYQALTDTKLLLAVSGSTCNADFDMEIEETPSEIRISINASSGDGNDCQTLPVAELASDLRDRTVIDALTGKKVRRVER